MVLSLSCFSQNKQLLYNFKSIPQSMMTNPGADVNYHWYLGIPFLSGVSVNLGSTGFSANDLFANNGVDFNIKLKNTVAAINRNDKLYLNEQTEIFNGGFKLGDWQKGSYFSFGMYQEMDLLAYMPKDYALIALYGNKNEIGKVYDFGDLNVRGELISVFHLGFHTKVNEKLILGARGKIYSSIFNIQSTHNSGYFYTNLGTNSFYDQVISPDVKVNTSGLINYTQNYSGDGYNDILKKTFLGGNLGLGVDLGLTYYPKKNIEFTASILDIGFINHTKQVENYRFKGYYKYEGLNPNFLIGSGDKDIAQEFTDAVPLDTLYNSYKTMRPIKFNTSYQYSFGVDRGADCTCLGKELIYKNAIGAQFFAMSTPRDPLMALTGYYKRRVYDSLELKATYTIDSFSYKNIGLGLSTNLGKVNFYILADNLLEYRDVSKANSISFQFGLNILFPDKKTLE